MSPINYLAELQVSEKSVKVHPSKFPVARNTQTARSSCSDKNFDKPERRETLFHTPIYNC